MKWFGRILTLSFIAWTLWAGLTFAQGGREVVVVTIEGPVTPVMLSKIERAIAETDERNAEALVIQLNTPGGEIELTRKIIQTIIAADVPVVVYIWPPGGFAASAGTFITMAGHVAAMAPNTSIGAASPVDNQGGDIGETLRAKVENMLVADIKNLAGRRGDKAVEWAQQAITEARAATAEEALELGVIDFIAADLEDLLAKLDGDTVEIHGKEITLSTGDARITRLETTLVEEILGIITNPTIALLLISLGGLALAYEIINPGGYMSGIVGIILLVVGLYAVGQLPVNYAGLALILLAFALFIAEFFVHSMGALTVTAVVAFIVGGLILFNTGEFTYRLPLPSIIGIPLGLAAFFVFVVRKVFQARQFKPVTGKEGLIGSTGSVRVALEPEGTIFVWGERWHAVSEDGQALPAGTQVLVTGVDGLKLKVRRM